MGEVRLLDCTLRDGGYVIDWKFGHNNLISIFERLVDAEIDIVEIGFLDERRSFDMHRSIMPDTDSVEKIYGKLQKKNTMIVGMIDYGTCSLANVKPCAESFLDGIRVIFKKHMRKEALQFCADLKALGYKVFVQLVATTSYDDEEMYDLIRQVNEIEPYAVSMVDTYGLMHQDNLEHYFVMLNEKLKSNIALGYHAHNNFQMGYANCIAMLSHTIDRTMIVDGSIYGMGKSAGNAPIELIAMHMNHKHGKHYHISQILEAIDSNISQFYHSSTWGYNMFYYVAAANDCHPNYVAYLMDKRTLSIKSVNEILQKIQKEKKLLYDQAYIEELYVEYQKNEVNDEKTIEQLRHVFENRKILLVGPGKTVHAQKEKIEHFIRQEAPITIAINYIPDEIEIDYVFFSNAKRYLQAVSKLGNRGYHMIATSNVTGTRADVIDYVLNYSSLIDLNEEIIDNSLIMLIKALLNAGVGRVTLAGFDGYSKNSANYISTSMEYDFIKDKAEYLNQYTSTFLNSVKEKMKVHFLTDSKYESKNSETDVL